MSETGSLRGTISRLRGEAACLWPVILGRLFGASAVVRYLRNPRPRATSPLLQHFGARVGPGTTIKRSLVIDNVYEDLNSAGDFSHLDIGANCYIGDEVYLDLADRIVIDDNAVLSGRVSLLSHADCNRSAFLDTVFPARRAPVRIGAGAWIGFGAIVMAGVTVGTEAVVAAGAVVTRDVARREVVAGVPARSVRSLV